MNILIWGFEELYQSFYKLEKSNDIKIKVWFGEKDKYSFCNYEVKELYNGKTFNSYSKKNYNKIPDNIYNKIYKNNLVTFFNRYSRTIDGEFNNFHENLDKFNFFITFFYDILKSNKINVSFFSSIPHFGPDLILYELCKELNIKTILTQQSLFSNRFYYLYDINDFGDFNQIKSIETKSIQIVNKFEKDLFYMQKLPKKKSCLRKLIGEFFRIPFSSRKNLTYENSLNKYSKTKKYYKNLKNYQIKDINLNCKFIYFPLHLQPELTTSALGYKYSDQLLAIENLSRILPKDLYIYVKENPKQTYQERNESFFKRLTFLDNVFLIDKKINTYELIKKSQFVASITGTVGWEAITGGKPALIFGNAWYKSLHGVFKFDENFDLKKITNFIIDENKLQLSFNKLLEKTREGVVDKNYRKIVTNYNNKINIDSIERFIKEELVFIKRNNNV